MDAEKRLELVMRNTQEIVTVEELRKLLEEKENPTAYIGFEPSGFVHIAQGMICARKIKDMQEAGFRVKIFLADWHAFINDKLGGDIDNIRACGEYMKDAFLSLGIDPDKTEFVWASDIITPDYWEKVLRIAKVSSLARVKRALTIMGRKESEVETDVSKLIYPPMQAADIYQLDVDVAYGGMDQRKAHMLARDAGEKLGWRKPIALHTPLLSGLKGGSRMDPVEAKMSKSDPYSSILIHDSPDDIRRKMKKAYCPEGVVEGNPVMDIARHIVFPQKGRLLIERPEKWGGNLEFSSYDELEKVFVAKELHPMDLKAGVADALIELLEPARRYFEEHPENLKRLKDIIGRRVDNGKKRR